MIKEVSIGGKRSYFNNPFLYRNKQHLESHVSALYFGAIPALLNKEEDDLLYCYEKAAFNQGYTIRHFSDLFNPAITPPHEFSCDYSLNGKCACQFSTFNNISQHKPYQPIESSLDPDQWLGSLSLCNHKPASTPLRYKDDEFRWYNYCKICGDWLNEFKATK